METLNYALYFQSECLDPSICTHNRNEKYWPMDSNKEFTIKKDQRTPDCKIPLFYDLIVCA